MFQHVISGAVAIVANGVRWSKKRSYQKQQTVRAE
ncbi:Protein of unknown function [Leuconostoc citreum]|nr:Protein of unknown function [Leuconostoc citreum]